MTEKKEGQFETADGTFETNQENQIVAELIPSDEEKSIKYSSHKKLLNQHKSAKEELEELRAYKKQKSESEAMERGEHVKIIAARDEELLRYKTELEGINRDRTDGAKINAFMESLPGKVKRQEYLSFVDLESIAVDPETNKVDSLTLEKVVTQFVENFPDLIQPATSKKLPTIGSIGGNPNLKKSLKNLSREELRNNYIAGKFNL